jgi:hypothetical protein
MAPEAGINAGRWFHQCPAAFPAPFKGWRNPVFSEVTQA